MPLKKPKDIPKLPKTRKKSIDALKKAIPLKKKSEAEYNLEIYFFYDNVIKKQFVAIEVLTVKDFTYLNYEIALDYQIEKDEIDISILGLNMVYSYVVEPKPASRIILLEDLAGDYKINVLKQDGRLNILLLEINPFRKKITFSAEKVPTKKNNTKFCTFKINEQKNTFEESFKK